MDDVSRAIPLRCMVRRIGPDRVAKSSVLSLIAGSGRVPAGSLEVLGGEMASARHPTELCPRVAYMPQGLSRDLCPDLSVRENIAFCGRLFGQTKDERDRSGGVPKAFSNEGGLCRHAANADLLNPTFFDSSP